MKIEAKLYDGKSSKEYIVDIEFRENKRVIINEFDIDEPIKNIKISSRLGNTPRLIEFPNGIRCKSDENDKIDSILKNLNIKTAPIHKLEKSWKLAISSIFVIVAFIVFMLTSGADYTANYLSTKLPKNILNSASIETLKQLDKTYLQESNLTQKQKNQILKLFQKLTDNSNEYKLHFRSSPKIGANAFALPSGDIILLDELVFLDKNSNYYGVLGVLAHEKGHYVYRHGLKILIKGTIATSIISYFTGDVSFIATTLPTILVTSKYSREYERQADIYAKGELERLNISSKPLANIFVEIEKENSKDNNLTNLLSTHPITKERIDYFSQED